MLRKVRNLWDKMEQLVSGRRRVVRFEKQLQDCFKDMPQMIIDLLYKIIFNGDDIPTDSPASYLETVTGLLGLKVEYFTISEKEQLEFFTFGDSSELTLRFGLFQRDGIFGYVGKLPEKQEVQVNKEVTMTVFAEIAATLTSMYEQNSKEYTELGSVKGKPGKLRRSGSVLGEKPVFMA
jgi:predicted Zn-dependent protease with MMP-like domain